MNIIFKNIFPGPEFDVNAYLESYGQDVLNVVGGIYVGDIYIESSQYTILLPRVQFIDFSRRIFVTSFYMNFHESNENTISLDTPDERGEIKVILSNSKIIVILRLGATRSLQINGEAFQSGDDMKLVFELLEFNRMCGMMYSRSIDFLEERFRGLDGIQDYFGLIPFYEGFDEDLP